MFVFPMDRPKMPPRWAEFREWLCDLDEGERLYVRRWILRYVNRWRQIPVLASYLSSAIGNRTPLLDHNPPDGSGRAR